MDTLQSILIIVTSFSEIAPGEPTGLWLEEFAQPYIEFKHKGFKVSVASIQGGKGNDYYVTVKAVWEVDGGIQEVLGETEVPLGKY